MGNEMGMKVCRACGESKSADCFYGYRATCSDCVTKQRGEKVAQLSARVNMERLRDRIGALRVDQITPLLLYRGRVSPSQMSAMWNFTHAMMDAGLDTIADGATLSTNRDITHWCGSHAKAIQSPTMQRFMARLIDNPAVMRATKGLSEYVYHLRSTHTGAWLDAPERIAVESPWRVLVPWRNQKRVRKAREPKVRAEDVFYPYFRQKDAEGDALIHVVHDAVPRSLPSQLRGDVCQDLIVAVLSGEMRVEDLTVDRVKETTRAVFKMFPMKYGHLSLDAPVYSDTNRTLGELLDLESRASSLDFSG